MPIVNENRPVRPHIQNIDKFSQSELFQIARNDKSSSEAFQCLIELVRRTTEKNQELAEKVILLEQEVKNLQMALNPPKKKCGRKAEEFFIHGKMLDDEYLAHLIDNEFYTIRKLEKEIGANKNQLRRRYERYKKKEERKG